MYGAVPVGGLSALALSADESKVIVAFSINFGFATLDASSGELLNSGMWPISTYSIPAYGVSLDSTGTPLVIYQNSSRHFWISKFKHDYTSEIWYVTGSERKVDSIKIDKTTGAAQILGNCFAD